MKWISFLLVWANFALFAGGGPDYFIIGAQKSGTTALFNLLQQHPYVAKQKGEIHFFDLNYAKGQEWYEKRFVGWHNHGLIAGDKSPYYLFHPLAAERLHKYYPDAKIFIVLRNPIDRSYSHYWFNRRGRREALTTFEKAIRAEDKRLAGLKECFYDDPLYKSFNYMHYSYLARSRYVEQIREWLKYFPRDQIMIVDANDLRHNTVDTLSRAFSFLGLHNFKVSDKNAHRHSDYPKIEDDIREELSAYFKPYNLRLEKLLDVKFNWD